MTRFSCPSYLFVMLLTAGCASFGETGHARADADYHKLTADYIAGYLEWRPLTGTNLGLHEYDGRAPDLSMQSIEREHARLRDFRSRIAKLDASSLSRDSAIQRRALLASIDSELFGLEVLDSYRKNPMTYAGAIDVNVYAKRNFAPKPERLRSVVQVLRHVPDVIAAGRANLQERLPKTYIEIAILNANGGADFLKQDLVEAFADVRDAQLQSEFKSVNDVAQQSLRAFAAWLKTDKLPNATDDFRIGRDRFVRMLRQQELIEQSPEEILDLGLRELRHQQEVFAQAAREIDSTKPPIEVFKAIQHDHPTAESLLPDARKHLEMIRSFLIDRDIVRFPSDVRVIVDETPKFERATSFASMDAPGPFEQKATEAYYYVTPVEPEWDAKKREEWLTAFNYYTTDVVSIHEAYPGHYVQLLHLKASAADKVDKTIGSYAFTEGWAHYCEQMAIDEGYPGTGDTIATTKYRLAQADEALLRVCRLCVAIKMHCQGMNVEDATKFFIDNCYYEPATARSEAERGTYDPGYCFYTIGKLQILKLRDDYKRQEGSGFSLKKFHDAVLSHGAPPVRLLRQILLKDSSLWSQSL